MNLPRNHWLVRIVIAGLALFAHSSGAIPIVFSGSGANATSIQGTVDAFRATIGGINNGSAIGSQLTGRREIDWGNFAMNLPNPTDAFIGRGAVISTPGLDFAIFPVTPTFNAPTVLAPRSSILVDAFFTVPGSNQPAVSRAFGAVFSDVDLPNLTSITFLDSTNNPLASAFVPAANMGLSFLGVYFTDPDEQIASVRFSLGNGVSDLVYLNHLIFAEPIASARPQPLPEPGSLLLLSVSLLGAWFAREKSRKKTHI